MKTLTRVLFAFKMFYRIAFSKIHFSTDGKTFYQKGLCVNQAQAIIDLMQDSIQDTLEPIKLVEEANQILNPYSNL